MFNESENETTKLMFEIIVWGVLLFFSYAFAPVLIIVVLAAMFLSFKIGSNNTLLRQHIQLLQSIEYHQSK